MNKQHLSYVDIAKGLLILLCIECHLLQVTKHPVFFNVDNPALNSILEYNIIYTPFFMGAFFFVSGFCSRFQETFAVLMKKTAKNLLLPAITLGIVSYEILLVANHCTDVVEYLKIISPKKILNYGGDYWFISALVVSRIICWLMFRYVRNYKAIFCLALLFLVVGVGFSNSYSGRPYWYFYHGFAAVFFLVMGFFTRLYSDVLTPFFKYSIPVYFLTLAGCLYFKTEVPVYAMYFNVPYQHILILITLSLGGSVMILYLSQLIGTNRFLEFWGRNSIVGYCLQIALFVPIQKVCLPLIDINPYLFFVVVFVAFLVVCYLMVRLLNLPYVRASLGKF